MSAIREDIKKAYTDAVQSGNSTGKVYITDMMDENYSDKGAETEEVQSFGCGDPVRAALLKEGERVLDLGCGAGFDLILASKKVGDGCKPYSDYLQMLEETEADLVTLCTPSGLHPYQAIEAAQSGKNILSEKPQGC